MASYLALIEQLTRFDPQIQPVNFLVSGSDLLIHERVFTDICDRAYSNGKNIVILDDNLNINLQIVSNIGFRVLHGFSEGFVVSDILDLHTLKGLGRLRGLLGALGYSEHEKQRLIAYLNFIQYVEQLSTGNQNIRWDIDILNSYSTVMLVEIKLQKLVSSGIINGEQQRYLLSKYAEVCSAGADFENAFYLLRPFVNGSEKSFHKERRTAYLFSMKEFSRDQVMKQIAAQTVMDALEDSTFKNAELIITDEGAGKNRYLPELIENFSRNSLVHLLTGDMFSMGDSHTARKIFNQFHVRVYGRHISMASCEAVSSALGQEQILKQSYSVTYDRRWRANSPWDILFGKNKAEVYGSNPVWEAKYTKECINMFPTGEGIIEYMGNSSVFNV